MKKIGLLSLVMFSLFSCSEEEVALLNNFDTLKINYIGGMAPQGELQKAFITVDTDAETLVFDIADGGDGCNDTVSITANQIQELREVVAETFYIDRQTGVAIEVADGEKHELYLDQDQYIIKNPLISEEGKFILDACSIQELVRGWILDSGLADNCSTDVLDKVVTDCGPSFKVDSVDAE